MVENISESFRMCQICDIIGPVIGIHEFKLPNHEENSIKLKDWIDCEVDDNGKPILEKIRQNITYHLGNAMQVKKLSDVADALFDRDYKEKKQIFVPEIFLTKNPKLMFNDAENLNRQIKTSTDYPKAKLDKWRGEVTHIKGEALEKTVYDTLKSFFQQPENKNQEVLVLHGYEIMDLRMKKEQKDYGKREKDFLIVNLTLGYIMNIEAKSSLNKKTLKDVKEQLENTRKLLEEWFGADLNPGWQFISGVYCEKESDDSHCEIDFVFTSSEDLSTKLEKIHENLRLNLGRNNRLALL